MKFSLNIFKQKEKEIFAEISGYDNIKEIFDNALKSPVPIHILLDSDPGMGKTRFLKAIEKAFPDESYFALGSGATGAGMVNKCFEKQPRFLLIDEIEDLPQNAQTSLLSLMQDGVLTETKIKNTREISFKCSVFATCNSIKRIKERMLSRFVVIHIEPYTDEEFVKVAQEQLKDKCSMAMADFIISRVAARPNRNVRDCIKIAALCRNEAQVLKYLETVK